MAVLVCNQVTTKVTSSARTKTVQAVVERDNQTLVSLSVSERHTDPDLGDKGGGGGHPDS